MKLREMTMILALALGLTINAAWCNAGNTRTKATVPSSEHQSAAGAYAKSVEESKRITVARVNGAVITMRDLINEMSIVAPAYLKKGQKFDPKIDREIRKDALNRLIVRELAIQEAVRQGMKVTPRAVADEVKKAKDALKTQKAYNEALERLGLTEAQFKKKIDGDLLAAAITKKEVFDKVQVSPLQIEEAYDKDKASYAGHSTDEVRSVIEQKLKAPLIKKRSDAWVSSLKKNAKIEIMPDNSTGGPKQ
jgi:SurA-like N-terminal domain